MQFEAFDREQLKQLPYVDVIPVDDRIVNLQSYYDSATRDWHLYMPVRAGELGRMAGGEAISGSYLARAAADTGRDVEFDLGTLVVMNLSYRKVLKAFAPLESDIHRCAAILEKFHLFSLHEMGNKGYGTLLVGSELEYLLYLLRSLYDLLQGLVGAIAEKLVLLDGRGTRVMRNLPSSFAEVALVGDTTRTAADMNVKWGIPTIMGAWYEMEAPFFRVLRTLRDDIAHRGASHELIFATSQGFAIDPRGAPWSSFDFWPIDRRFEQRLGSLRVVFASFIVHTLSACKRFAEVMRLAVTLPPSLSADTRLYIRSPMGSRLVGLHQMIEQPWELLDFPPSV